MVKFARMVIVLMLALCASVINAKIAERESCDAGNSARDSQMRRRVVAVIGPEMSGSGVLISPDEVLMTAHEIMNEKVSVQVVTCDWETIRGTVVWVDTTLDLALVKIEGSLPYYFSMQGNPVRAGEAISTIGQPDGTAWMISTGVVLKENKAVRVRYPDARTQEHSLIISSAYTKQGGSGGALVDERGQLVGIIIADLSLQGVDGNLSTAQSITNFCRAYAHPLCPP